MKILILQIIIVLLTFYFVSNRAGLIGLSLVFLKFVWDLGVFTSIKIYSGKFTASEIFYIEYTGEYSKVVSHLQRFGEILQKFKIKDPKYSLFGIYYDDQIRIVDKSKSRAIIGICREIYEERGHNINENDDFVKYLTSEGFKIAKISDSVGLFASFPYIYQLSLYFGINKYYQTLISSLKNEEFQRQFRVKEGDFKFSVEVYRENEIRFYVPLKNQEQFMLHSSPAPELKN